jgi:hypothetical protein
MSPERPRKRSPKEIIEEAQPANVEHAFGKPAGNEIRDITKEGTAKIISTEINSDSPHFKHHFIHTHPSKFPEVDEEQMRAACRKVGIEEKYLKNVGTTVAALHSATDIETFLNMPEDIKFATIAVRDPESGDVLGYNVLKRADVDTNDYVALYRSATVVARAEEDLFKLKSLSRDSVLQNNPSLSREAYDAFLKRYGLKSRLVPAEGYKVNEYGTAFVKKEE